MLPIALLAGGLGMAACVDFAPAQDDPGKPKTPQVSARQKRTMVRLLAEFRRTRSKSRRDGIVKRLFALGTPGVQALRDELDTQLADAMARYENAFTKRAAALAKSRRKDVKPAEIQGLRSKVLALRRRPDLTKEMIVQVADPALKKLHGLLALDRRAVLKNAPRATIELRKRVQAVGRYHELCTRQLARANPAPRPIRRTRRKRRPKRPPGFEDYLRDRERIAAQVAGDGNARMLEILAANSKLAARLDPEEARNILYCNLTRNLLGLPVLAVDLKLSAAARDHSSDMQRLKFFSHTSPIPEKRTYADRAVRFGTRASGENIFMGRTDGYLAHDGWFHSPGHHRNMLAGHSRIGVGRIGLHFTQLFGR
ncbi:MAG: CAP domain-containing protein [Planctomycetaceae bacterium]